MKLPNISGLVNVVKTFAIANRPEILLGAAVISTIGTGVLAAQGGYKARGIVDAAEAEKGEPIDVKEKIQLTWLCYIPATIAATTSIGSVAGLHLVHVKDKKALATAGMAALEEAKEAAEQYRNELVGVASEEKGKEVDDKIHSKRADEDGISRVMNGDGEVEELFLVREPISGRDVWANKARMEEAMLEVGNMVNGSGNASLNNFYEQAGFVRLDSAESVGWSGVLPSLSWNDENGIPICGVRDDGRPWRGFRFLPAPEKGYDSNH